MKMKRIEIEQFQIDNKDHGLPTTVTINWTDKALGLGGNVSFDGFQMIVDYLREKGTIK